MSWRLILCCDDKPLNRLKCDIQTRHVRFKRTILTLRVFVYLSFLFFIYVLFVKCDSCWDINVLLDYTIFCWNILRRISIRGHRCIINTERLHRYRSEPVRYQYRIVTNNVIRFGCTSNFHRYVIAGGRFFF